MDSESISQPAPYVDHGCCINPEHLADLMRLKLGTRWLIVVTGRGTNGGTQRTREVLQEVYGICRRMRST
jgi:hypothetical protein